MDGRRLAQAGALATALTAAVVLLLSGRTRDDPPPPATDTDAVAPQGPGLAAAPLLRGTPSLVPGASPGAPVVAERPRARDLPATIEALRSPDEAARAEASRSLAAAGKDAVEPLLAAVRRDVVAGSGLSDFAVNAMLAFGGLGEVGAPALARAIGDPEPRMSFWCVAIFSRLGALRRDLHAAVPVLQEHLRGGTPKAIQNASEVLGSIGVGAQAAVPDLARCLRAEEVRRASRLRRRSAASVLRPRQPCRTFAPSKATRVRRFAAWLRRRRPL